MAQSSYSDFGLFGKDQFKEILFDIEENKISYPMTKYEGEVPYLKKKKTYKKAQTSQEDGEWEYFRLDNDEVVKMAKKPPKTRASCEKDN